MLLIFNLKILKRIIKYFQSSDYCLQLNNIKSELIVIKNKNVFVKIKYLFYISPITSKKLNIILALFKLCFTLLLYFKIYIELTNENIYLFLQNCFF